MWRWWRISKQERGIIVDNSETIFGQSTEQKSMLEMSLEQRLNHLLQDDLERCNTESIERVRQFVQLETENPSRRLPYKLFETVEDFELYYKLHPEWHGKSTTEMQADKESGAAAFYSSFNKFTQQIPDRRQRLEIRKRLLNNKYESRSSLVTIDDWTGELNAHPDWQGKTAGEILSDKNGGGRAFYAAARKWARIQTQGDRKALLVLMDSIFNKSHKIRKHENIDEWKKEYFDHPEWHGYTAKRMLNDKDSGASSFYRALLKWSTKQAKGDRQKRNELVRQALSPERFQWTGYTTIDDWFDEFEQHPEWQGRSPTEMINDVDPKARTFYKAFGKWVVREAKGDRKINAELRARFFHPQINRRYQLVTEAGYSISPKEAREELWKFVEVVEEGDE